MNKEFEQFRLWTTVRLVKKVASSFGYFGDPIQTRTRPLGSLREEDDIVTICTIVSHQLGHRHHRSLIPELVKNAVLGARPQRHTAYGSFGFTTENFSGDAGEIDA